MSKQTTYYAIYESPFGKVAYKFTSDTERRKFIEDMGHDFCGIPTAGELAAIKRNDIVIFN